MPLEELALVLRSRADTPQLFFLEPFFVEWNGFVLGFETVWAKGCFWVSLFGFPKCFFACFVIAKASSVEDVG